MSFAISCASVRLFVSMMCLFIGKISDGGTSVVYTEIIMMIIRTPEMRTLLPA